MKSFNRIALWWLGSCVALAVAPGLAAQPAQRPVPHIGYVYPAGGQQGKTITVFIGGQNLLNPAAAYFSTPGIKARIIGYERPMTQKEINDAREKVQELVEKRAKAQKENKNDKAKAWTPADEAQLAELRKKLMTRPGRQANPAIAETVTVELTIAPNMPPGEHDLRLRTANGLSNPFTFCVGQLPEITEPVVTSTSPILSVPRIASDAAPRTARAKAASEITLPATLNGQILPGEVDRFRFSGKKGQKLTLVANARSLIPYLADAVPGWFQPTLALFDAKGRELSYDDDFRFNPDPVVCYELPADGEYTVEIKDSIFRGREDFVYRLAIGELPFVTSIFPLGTTPKKEAAFELAGWNLPSDRLVVDTLEARGTFRLNVRNQGVLSNAVKFAVDTDPSVEEVEPNNTREAAQSVAVPQVINGRIGKNGDEDFYRFEGRAGSPIIAEVFARRLNSPLDSILELTDSTGRVLALNDDHDDKGAGLLTHQADSCITFTPSADGTYFLRIRDTQSQGGSDYAYRLRLAPPRQDFDLRVAPATLNLRAGGSATLTVYVLRRDGFNGEISLGVTDRQRGFYLSGSRVPPGQDKVTITVSALGAPLDEPVSLSIAGRASINGNAVVHRAVPAEDMMQAFAYRHLVPAKELMANVSGRGGAMFRVAGEVPLRLPGAGTTTVRLSSPAVRGVGTIGVDLMEAPEGLSVVKSSCRGEEIEVVLACDPAKVKAWSGNLILNVHGERNNGAGKQKKAQSWIIGTVPAIPAEIVATNPPTAQ